MEKSLPGYQKSKSKRKGPRSFKVCNLTLKPGALPYPAAPPPPTPRAAQVSMHHRTHTSIARAMRPPIRPEHHQPTTLPNHRKLTLIIPRNPILVHPPQPFPPPISPRILRYPMGSPPYSPARLARDSYPARHSRARPAPTRARSGGHGGRGCGGWLVEFDCGLGTGWRNMGLFACGDCKAWKGNDGRGITKDVYWRVMDRCLSGR